jgi:uncharacterized protein
MADELRLKKPWLVAVWPGMGHVAISAGYYLMAKLGMHRLAEFSAEELFDVGHVDVKGGLIRTGRLPQSRLFVWNDPSGQRDLIVFIGEAQPPLGKYVFCRRLIEAARQFGVERVFTFAAMATQMHPGDDSRVFGAATDEENLVELKRLKLKVLEDGHIGGLNGVLLGVAAESALHGACLLGEMPHMFAQLPFPKASLAVLKAFTALAGISIDYTEMSEQAKHMEKELGKLMAQIEANAEQQSPEPDEEETIHQGPSGDDGIGPDDREQIEQLFAQAGRDRSKAYELKRVLDRLAVYKEYEDRFLDLFKKPG